MLVPAANGRVNYSSFNLLIYNRNEIKWISFLLKGAAIGMLTSHMITLIIICGSFTIVKSPAVVLPTSVEVITDLIFILMG